MKTIITPLTGDANFMTFAAMGEGVREVSRRTMTGEGRGESSSSAPYSIEARGGPRQEAATSDRFRKAGRDRIRSSDREMRCAYAPDRAG